MALAWVPNTSLNFNHNFQTVAITVAAIMESSSQESPNKTKQEEDYDELENESGSDDGEHDPNIFKIRGQLRQGTAKIYTTKDLHGIPVLFMSAIRV